MHQTRLEVYKNIRPVFKFLRETLQAKRRQLSFLGIWSNIAWHWWILEFTQVISTKINLFIPLQGVLQKNHAKIRKSFITLLQQTKLQRLLGKGYYPSCFSCQRKVLFAYSRRLEAKVFNQKAEILYALLAFHIPKVAVEICFFFHILVCFCLKRLLEGEREILMIDLCVTSSIHQVSFSGNSTLWISLYSWVPLCGWWCHQNVFSEI